MDESIRLVFPASDAEVSEPARHLVATGRGALKYVLGHEHERYRLMAGCIRWDCVVLAMRGDQALGFAAIKRQGRGPYAPDLGRFVEVFGWRAGIWRWAAFRIVELRDWRADAYLYGLKVVPQARREGIGAALLDEVCTLARRQGAMRIVLEVSDRNTGAQSLYVKMGFRIERVRRLGWFARFFTFSALHVMVRELGE